MSTRTETDSLGEISVPKDVYYGAQTERARRNFAISGVQMPARFLAAMALIKAEAARVNAQLGVVPRDLAAAIGRAAEEVVDGTLADNFPLDVFQTGSGTSSNMNVNEVIANRAIEMLGGEIGSRKPVHPNDHVNASQSSNDTVPTAIHIAAYMAIVEELQPALLSLQETLVAKGSELDDVVKIGRTHLQDAVPVRLGQELGGYAQQIGNGIARLEGVLPRLSELALGGTAVGTGLNAPQGFAEEVIAGLAARTNCPFTPAPNRFEAIGARDATVECSGALKTIAASLTKISNDIRWLASGPRCGLGEITIPSLQPGSSIMPGKVNPVLPEAVLMVGAQVAGNDAAITHAGFSGNLELNVMMPLIAHNLLQSIEILSNSSRLLSEHCIAGIAANRVRTEALVEQSLALCTALVPRIGYDRAATIAKEALASGRTVREVVTQEDLLSKEEIVALLDPRKMTEC